MCTLGKEVDALQSEAVALNSLDALHPNTPPAMRYRAAARVASAARMAVAYREASRRSDLTVLPLLGYYALLHVMKVFLHLRDLQYPATTAVLQHGLSTRRAKREAYRWVYDTVHVYKEGVIQSCAAIQCPHKPLPPRFTIGDLLGSLPYMRHAVAGLHAEFVHLHPVSPAAEDPGVWHISRAAASNRGMTVDEWKRTYATAAAATGQRLGPQGWPQEGSGFAHVDENSGAQTFTEPAGFLALPIPPHGHPWALEWNGVLYVADASPPPRWMVHFVLLYSLSTLCRYHPLEWSDVLYWGNEVDAYLVRAYLDGVHDAWEAAETLVRTGYTKMQ